MTITEEADLEGLKEIGRIVANTLRAMARAMEPGMTTAELDAIGLTLLEREGAVSAPQSAYDFPGTTCISVNEEVAHGIPGPRVLRAGDLVNIDVSASKDGYFADTGSTHRLAGEGHAVLDQLCRDGRRAMDIGIDEVYPGRPLAAIGHAIGRFAEDNGYTLIRNLASHGVGRSLHEYPGEIATWPTQDDLRVMEEGLVFTVEPFLSLGGHWAGKGEDGWTLYAMPSVPCVQYEHTVVVTRSGPLILTLPG